MKALLCICMFMFMSACVSAEEAPRWGRAGFCNEVHPEIKKGETFLGNYSQEDFKKVNWKSKRKGKVAYDIYGNKISGAIYREENPVSVSGDAPLFPVFVQVAETGRGMSRCFSQRELADMFGPNALRRIR